MALLLHKKLFHGGRWNVKIGEDFYKMTFSATSTYLISQHNGKIDHSEILFEKENAHLSVALAKATKES